MRVCLSTIGAFVITASKGATLTVADSEFTDNYATAYGGAISLDGASLAITDSQFVNNTAQLYGGAIAQTSGPTDKITIAGSAFTGNEAGCQGGALFFYDLDSVTVTNSTFDASATAFGPTATAGLALQTPPNWRAHADATQVLKAVPAQRIRDAGAPLGVANTNGLSTLMSRHISA